MKKHAYSLLITALLGMWGTQAGAQDLTTTEVDGVTYYEIASGADLVAFADLVNTGDGTAGANALLTADIKLESPWEKPIGFAGLNYTGIFDGQGHSITGFETECTMDGGGLFGYTKEATIKNFSIDGTLTSTAGTGSGVVGYPSSSTITGIHSSLDISVPVAGVHHVGGVVGSARGGNTISGCTFTGTMTVAAGSTDNFAGVVAYLGGDSVSFCANYGTITFDDMNCAAGGVAGYLNNTGSYVKGCLNVGSLVYSEEEGTPKWGGAIVGRLRTHDLAKVKDNCWLSGSATGAGKDNDGKVNLTSAACITEAQLSSGEACYLLNGDQTVVGWYQTLGEDERPTLEQTHKQVYMNGHLHCNGDIYEGATFSNTDAGTIQDDHVFQDGFCTYCHLFDQSFITPNAEGFYEIANAKQLVWFEQLVNGGKLDANAVLTADIDFADLMPEGEDPEVAEVAWTPIGDWGATRGVAGAAYKGHFDGQGHTIKHLNATSAQNYFGVFGVISTDCLIENFTIYGTYRITYQYAGSVAAYARDDRPTIRNIHSYVNIFNTSSGGRQGGILGGVLTTTFRTTVENCAYSGTLDGNDAGGSGNYGGIVGYVNNNSATVLDITNCLFDGKVINSNAAPGGCTFGGFVGYSNGGAVTIKNSLSIGQVESAIWGQFFGAVKSTRSSLPNSFYVGEILNGSASTVTLKATETNFDELASGAVCWKLNEESFLDAVWRQTLRESAYPVPLADEAIVYRTPDGYECVSPDDPSTLYPFVSGIIASETEFIENTVAYQPLLDAYKSTVESWEGIETYDAFIAAYQASVEQKESIRQSAAAYAAYVAACEGAIAYLSENSVEGTWSTFLQTYLQESVEPGTDYPHGSYAYIMENRDLDNEAIAAETAFVNQMLENAIAGGVTSGTEVTRLLANSTFADGFEGWTTETDGPTLATGGEKELMTIARGSGKGSFSFQQTLSEVPNGIYLMTLSGFFRAGTDVTSQFYAGQLYMNGTANYVMAIGEDVVPAEEAEDKVNCYLDSDTHYVTDDADGYVPNTLVGCSYAYNATRYVNYCATEVTDGTLTIGVRNLGTGLDSDWLPVGGMHVYYLGTAEEANEQLSDVLAAFAERAQVILDFPWSGDDAFAQYPNMANALKEQLTDLILEAASAATGEQKMALIGKFSTLFNEVHDCRMAYIDMARTVFHMFDYIDQLSAAGLIDNDEYNAMEEKIYAAWQNYQDGDVTAEQARAITAQLNETDLVLPVENGAYQLATADQLKLFSVLVNCGGNTTNAVLTADIDMSGIDDFQPIGTTANPFMAEFDGQGHKITGFGSYNEEDGFYTLNFVGDRQGFFGYVKNATIKNFSIDGTFTYDGGTGYGAIGWAEGSTLQNIHSSLRIASVSTAHHIGGICGDMRAGSRAIGCSFSGTITDSHNTHDCIGGIGGYSNENCLYENCANYGTIQFSNATAYASGICGYVNNDIFVGVNNCLNVGTVRMADGSAPTYGGAIVGRLRGHANSKFQNNYWLGGSAARAYGENQAEATQVTSEQLLSGEVCYKLNHGSASEGEANGDQTDINWFQTLGEDTYPVLFDSHKVVYVTEEGTYTNEKVSVPDGSKENPFVVKSATDLANLINKLVSGRMNYVVMEEDVDMAGVTDWVPLFNIPDQSNGYPFIDFDGKNHVIRGLTSNTTGAYDYCGLFGILCGNVRNLGVENADVTCAGGTGILAGYLGHSTYGQPCYVENVWVTGKLTANGYCGGLFGNVADEAHILNCYANVEVTGSGDLTGGIIGRVRNRVEMAQVYAAGSINRGGGIIGGGFQDVTPLGSYKNVAVWNNTERNFGPVREGEDLGEILYYDGTNFADMQSQVVAWDPAVWTCDMQAGSYPVLKAFAGLSGDLNGDGKVDIADAVTILNLMAEGSSDAAADLNGDGKVDIADFVTVLNIMAEQ